MSDVVAPTFLREDFRSHFPILREKVHGRPFTYLDSAASAQKPEAVIDAMAVVMRHQYANIHRGLHYMSEHTTEAYEAVRTKVARFLNAPRREEIIFTRNSTEAINLVAYSFGSRLKPGQAVLITELEHHSNIIPWQLLRDRCGVSLRVAPITPEGDLDLDAMEALLSDGKVALVAVTHMSNVLGTLTPISRIAALAHHYGAKLLVDGSQSVVHEAVDLEKLGADFFVFTGHKLYGPTGIGVLWGRTALLEAMPPFMGGGEMIESVTFEASSWAPIPHKFEAGTPPIIEVIGLGAAIDFLEKYDRAQLRAEEQSLTKTLLSALGTVKAARIIGAPAQRGGVVSFTLGNIHPHDLAVLLDQQGIAIRAGQHCAEPLLRRLGVTATARASLAAYSTQDDVEALMAGIEKAQFVFGEGH